MEDLMRVISKILFTCLLFCLVAAPELSALAEINYNIIHSDPENDVQGTDGTATASFVTGHENIDLLRLSSSKNPFGQNLIIELVVSGIIANADNISYSITVLEGEDISYLINYQNGLCTGLKIDDSETDASSDVLLTTGAGTDALKVTLPLKNLGELSAFDIAAIALEYNDAAGGTQTFSDTLPDGSFPWDDGSEEIPNDAVFITTPTAGGTVFGTFTIAGTANTDKYDIRMVEIQIDTNLASGWIPAESKDSWKHWDYSWDTSELGDGRHFILARAFDGEEYYSDMIEVYVDRGLLDSPGPQDMRALHAGDKYDYELTVNSNLLKKHDIERLSGTMTVEVVRISQETLNNFDYTVYDLEISGIWELESDSVSYNIMIEGQRLLRTSDLALVTETMEYRIWGSDAFGSEDRAEKRMDFEPPLNSYNFPISVTDKWDSESSITKSSKFVHGGYEPQVRDDEYSENREFECLRKGMISVPAGTFESYAVYSSVIEGAANNYVGFSRNGNASPPWEGLIFNNLNSTARVEFYSPETGFLSKITYFDSERNVLYSLVLTSFEYSGDGFEPENDDHGTKGPEDNEVPVLFMIDIVLVIVLILIVTLVRADQRRYRLSARAADAPAAANPPGSTGQGHAQGKVKITCPSCRRPFQISRTAGAVKIKCPYCNAEGVLEGN